MRRLGGVGGGLARAWLLVVLVPLLWDLRASAAPPQRLAASSLSPLRGTITDVGRADPNRRHSAVVGLVPRNPEALEAFLADVQDPTSPRYRQFLTQDEFNALYAPAEAAEQAVVAHLEASGLRVTQRFSNRLLVGATGTTIIGVLALVIGALLLSGASAGALVRRSGHAVRRAHSRARRAQPLAHLEPAPVIPLRAHEPPVDVVHEIGRAHV